jgi:hypothetical protein
MPTADDFLDYPKGTVAIGSGDLLDLFDWGFEGDDGEKIVATLRQNPAGSTFGTRSGKLNLSSAVSHLGFERDWLGTWQKRTVIEARLKLPGIVVSVTGRITQPRITGNIDDYIKFVAGVLGRPTFSLV